MCNSYRVCPLCTDLSSCLVGSFFYISSPCQALATKALGICNSETLVDQRIPIHICFTQKVVFTDQIMRLLLAHPPTIYLKRPLKYSLRIAISHN